MTRPGEERVGEKTPPAKEKPRRAPRPLPGLRRIGAKGESTQAKLEAAVVLEVLGGIRTPTDAAGALGISLPRYYVLEGRALGLKAPAPKAKEPGKRRRRPAARALRAAAVLRAGGLEGAGGTEDDGEKVKA
jgi:hypothetical protein